MHRGSDRFWGNERPWTEISPQEGTHQHSSARRSPEAEPTDIPGPEAGPGSRMESDPWYRFGPHSHLVG